MDQIIGWIGSFLVLIAYILNVLKIVKSDGRWYLIMNLLGSLALGVSVYFKQAWPNVFMELICFLIALVGIIKSLRK